MNTSGSTNTVALNPCPFCGCADEMKVIENSEMHEYCDWPDDSDPTYAVVCDASRNGSRDVHHGCGAGGGFKKTPEEAAQAWNRRQPSEPVAVPTTIVPVGYQYKFRSVWPPHDFVWCSEPRYNGSDEPLETRQIFVIEQPETKGAVDGT